MRINRVCASAFTQRPTEPGFVDDIRLSCISILAILCLLAPQLAHAQDAGTAVGKSPALQISNSADAETGVTASAPEKPPVEREIIAEGMVSYGNWQILASGYDCKLFTGGFEYDRHSWGHLLYARFDYSAEILPFVLLDEPAKADIWGNPKSKDKKHVPGLGFSPIGFRMMWFEKKRIKPYLSIKGGLLGFPIKVLSSDASYVNLSFQSGLGVQVRMTPRYDLRLGLFNDLHFSDGFIVPVNPGLDVMNSNLGLSYHFAK